MAAAGVQPRDGGDKVRPQAGPTWHGSLSPGTQALLRAVRTEGRTMPAPRTQERVQAPHLPFLRPCRPPLVSQVGARCCMARRSPPSHVNLLSLFLSTCCQVLATLTRLQTVCSPCTFSLGPFTPSTQPRPAHLQGSPLGSPSRRPGGGPELFLTNQLCALGMGASP